MQQAQHSIAQHAMRPVTAPNQGLKETTQPQGRSTPFSPTTFRGGLGGAAAAGLLHSPGTNKHTNNLHLLYTKKCTGSEQCSHIHPPQPTDCCSCSSPWVQAVTSAAAAPVNTRLLLLLRTGCCCLVDECLLLCLQVKAANILGGHDEDLEDLCNHALHQWCPHEGLHWAGQVLLADGNHLQQQQQPSVTAQ